MRRTSNSRNLFSVYLNNGGSSEQTKVVDMKDECQAMELHQSKQEPLFTAEILPDSGDRRGPAVILYKTPSMFDPEARISFEGGR
jgi:hypothetical protein